MLTTHRRNSRTRIDDCKYLMFFPPKQALSLLSLLYGLSSIKLLSGKWWVWVDSNHRPHPYQSDALMPTTPIVRPFYEYGKLSSQIVPRVNF